MKRTRGLVLGATSAVVLGLAGAAMLVLAKVTPRYSDPAAYTSVMDHLLERTDFTAMSAAFFAAQDKYATTNKWLYADVGYALVAWSVMTALCTLGGTRRLARTVTKVLGLVWLTLVASAVLTLGFTYGGVYQPMGRGQVPPWADSAAIPLIGIGTSMMILAPALALFALAPLLARPVSGERLLVLSRPPHWPAVLITLLYLPLLAACALLIIAAPTPGGWALSIAGALFGWLFLNARALAIGPKRS